ncbi:MAG: UDP-N-acetylmuramoyl-tripeptide--D-alanyl-D-alanine ligase [Burkholderiales bacterium]
MMQLGQAHAWLPGSRLVGNPQTVLARVHTDTRTLQPGDLFVALQGDRFDAHDFLPQAKAAGAVAAIAKHGLASAGLAGLEVVDTQTALGQLAMRWRSQFALPLIAVTGSNGKTTVTQMIASILRAWQPQAVLATEGNLNNHIGVPLTLLGLREQHRVAVVELGMNHPGEIAQLACITRPTVALVNNAQREHLEFMSSVEAVAQENGSVMAELPVDGVAVFPADDAYTPLWHRMAIGRKTLTFALAETSQADVKGSGQWKHNAWYVKAQSPAGKLHFSLRVAGLHNVKNALAAAACAIAAGVPDQVICTGLAQFEPVKGRSRAMPLTLDGHAMTLVDDTYNANPDSVRAAIDVLAALPGPRLLVLGDMGEVGNQGARLHLEVGAYAREKRIENLFAVGEQCMHAASGFGVARHYADMDALNAAVLAELPQIASVLIKGSRFMRMERVVQAIMAQIQAQEMIDVGANNHAA